jgi:hypothetical protein
MTSIQWFSFVIAPLGIAVIGVIVGESFRALNMKSAPDEASNSKVLEPNTPAQTTPFASTADQKVLRS